MRGGRYLRARQDGDGRRELLEEPTEEPPHLDGAEDHRLGSLAPHPFEARLDTVYETANDVGAHRLASHRLGTGALVTGVARDDPDDAVGRRELPGDVAAQRLPHVFREDVDVLGRRRVVEERLQDLSLIHISEP